VKVIDVSAGLVFRDGKLLVTQRPHAGHLGGLWEFPGGKRRAEETFEQCLHRELKEELGIEVDVHELVESITHEYPEKTVRLEFFRCSWRRHEPQALGCPAFHWIGREELARFEFPAADARLLERLRNENRFWQSGATTPA
jgi:mutator protein MutT